MSGAYWVVIATLTALFGDFLIKKASDGVGRQAIYVLLFATVVYALNTFAFFFSYKHVEFSSVAVYFSIGTLLVSVAIGAIFFKETISNGEWVGIILGILAIYFLTKYSA